MGSRNSVLSGYHSAWRRGASVTLSVASVVLLLVVAGCYATVVGARLLGYGVVVPANGGETTSAGSLLFVQELPLTEAHEGQTILVRDAEYGRATVERERIAALRRVHGALFAETERVGASSERRLTVLAGRLLSPGGSIPLFGHLVGALTTPLGWLLALVLPALWLAVSLLQRIWRGSRLWARSPLRGIRRWETGADESAVKRPLFGVDPLEETP